MKLTIIGCTGSMSGPRSAASSYLLQAEYRGRTWSVVFDLGPGAFGALWRYLDPRELDAVVFSHGHADHMGDVISLYVHHRWFPAGPLPAVPVYGPTEIEKRTCQIDGWAEPEDLAESLEFHVAMLGEAFQIGPFQITPFEGRHTVESFGYRVVGPSDVRRGETATFAFTGDTDTCDSMSRMAEGVDLLLCECAFTAADTVRGIHLDGARAGTLAREAGIGHLVLTHVQPWTNPDLVMRETQAQWSGTVDLAVAGQHYLL